MGEKYGTDNNIFPSRILEKAPGLIEREERYWYQYSIVLKYLKNKIANRNIFSFFEMIGVRKVALYAITEFTEMICDDLKNAREDVEVTYLCDRNAAKFKNGYKGIPVVEVEALVKDYRDGKVEKVMVCSVFHVNEIMDDLISKGVRAEDLVSVISVIFSL